MHILYYGLIGWAIGTMLSGFVGRRWARRMEVWDWNGPVAAPVRRRVSQPLGWSHVLFLAVLYGAVTALIHFNH